MNADIRSADTKVTNARGGGRFDEPRQVECPSCDVPGTTDWEVNLCDECGCWFEVVTEGDDSQKKAKEAGDS